MHHLVSKRFSYPTSNPRNSSDIGELNLATFNAPDNMSLLKAVFLKTPYVTPINLSFLTILVERSTSNITLNQGVSADSELKAQKPVLGRVTGTIGSSVAMRVFWRISEHSHDDGVVAKRITDWDILESSLTQ